MKAPADACDCHMHIYDHRFPVAPNAKLRPPDATVDDYRLLQKRLGSTRNVVVTPSTYGTDNSVTLDAIAKLGAAARGVAVVDASVTDAELKRLDGLGISRHPLQSRAVRRDDDRNARTAVEARRRLGLACANPHARRPDRANPGSPAAIALSNRVRSSRAHSAAGGRRSPRLRLREKADRQGADLGEAFERLPGFESRAAQLRRCLEGRAGLCEGRAGANGLGQRLAASDRKADAKPDDAILFDLLADWAPDEAVRNRILVDNPAALYRFGRAG